MLKTLIKKQYQECFRSYFVNPKTGKRRSAGGIFGMFVFFAAVMLFLAGVFFGLSFLMGDGLFAAGMEWLYFVLMGILSVLMGTFGSVFNTTHVLEVAEKLCDKVAIIKGGRLIRSGTMEDVRGDTSLESVFLELEG